jgi:hypothetical protein
LYERQLYKLGPDGILWQCLTFEEAAKISTDFHEGPRGHFGINTTIKKVLAYGYWWPTLNKDVAEMCQTCDICQWLTPMWWSNKGPF